MTLSPLDLIATLTVFYIILGMVLDGNSSIVLVLWNNNGGSTGTAAARRACRCTALFANRRRMG